MKDRNYGMSYLPEGLYADLRRLQTFRDWPAEDRIRNVNGLHRERKLSGSLLKSYDDCRHIAAAVLAKYDIIISWNFKHIVNIKTIQGVKAAMTYEGYKDLMIYQPSALLREER